jgi:hypothetical protein
VHGLSVFGEEDLDPFFLDDGHDFFKRGSVGCKGLRPNRATATFILYFQNPFIFIFSTIDENLERGSVALDASAQRRVNDLGAFVHNE